MAKAIDVANYFLFKDSDHTLFNTDLKNKNGRTFYEGNARLNKYLHLSQNVYIAKTGSKLFDDTMLAYDNGAVIPSIQKNYSSMIKARPVYHLTDQEKEFLDKMFYILKNAPTDELIELSHEDDAWREKSNQYYSKDEVMDSLAHADEYRSQYEDILKVMDNLPL